MNDLITTCPACGDRLAVSLGRHDDVDVFVCGCCGEEFEYGRGSGPG